MRGVLLTHSYLLRNDPHEQEILRPFPPLGLQSLVAYLRQQGVAPVEWFDSTFASDTQAVLDAVEAMDPAVVGFYGHTVTRPVAQGLIAACKAQGRVVVAGGPDPVQYLDEYLGFGVDVVVVGEGELTLHELVMAVEAHGGRRPDDATLRAIRGIAFRAGQELVRTEPRPLIRPLDRLPWPARDRRDHDEYFRVWRERHGETALSMVTSRGCPFHCSWCSKQVYGDTFRRRGETDVIDELVSLRERFDPDQIWFADDLFTINRAWVHRFCQQMVERRTTLPFYGIARPESLDAALCDALRRAGCYRIYCSAESGAQHVLDRMRKDSTVQDILRAGRLLRQAGIELGVFVMLGYPGESRQDIDRTLEMLHTLEPDVVLVSVAHPMKGTTFYDEVADRLVGAPDGGPSHHGGRLRFRMRYPSAFYDTAQRLVWTETELARGLRRGPVDARLLRLLVQAPALRSRLWWESRRDRGDAPT